MSSTLPPRTERPATSYDDACARFEALLRQDTEAVDRRQPRAWSRPDIGPNA